MQMKEEIVNLLNFMEDIRLAVSESTQVPHFELKPIEVLYVL